MTTLIGQFGDVATGIFSQVSTIATTITSTPLLLVGCGIWFIGGCIAMFGRLLSRG